MSEYMDDPISDETLNALVDGELEAAEAERIHARMAQDEALAARVCALQGLKAMVRQAYPEMAAETRRYAGGRRAWLSQALAASVLLLAGLGGGWWLAGSGLTSAPAAGYGSEVARLHPVQASAGPRVDRILLHLDSNQPEHYRRTLDQAEALIKLAREEQVSLRLEILVNSDGLDLVRADRSPHVERVLNMARAHDNLRFVACNNTIQRVRRAGQRVVLVPEVEVAPSAIGEIVDRLRDGWSYIKI